MIVSMMLVPTTKEQTIFLGNKIEITSDLLKQTQNIFMLNSISSLFNSSKHEFTPDDDRYRTGLNELMMHKMLTTEVAVFNKNSDDDEIITLENLYLKGDIIKYDNLMYGIKIENMSTNKTVKITKEDLKTNIDTFIKTSIAPVLQQLACDEWKIAFSLNGFIFHKKDIPQSIKPLENILYYTLFEDIVAIYDNKQILYYNGTELFPETTGRGKFEIMIAGFTLLIFGGTYLIINEDPYISAANNLENNDNIQQDNNPISDELAISAF